MTDNAGWATLKMFGAAFWPFVKFGLFILVGAAIFGVCVSIWQRRAR